MKTQPSGLGGWVVSFIGLSVYVSGDGLKFLHVLRRGDV